MGIVTKRPIVIIQGAQWGSEAKGMVAAEFCINRNIQYAVRTGTVNAGHTVYHNHHPVKMQQLPTGWVNPETVLVLGPGAFIHPEILAREIDLIQFLTGEDIRSRLLVDFRCGLHLPYHTERATAAGRHHKMGATGKGCSEAIVEKISGRGTTGRTFKQWLDSQSEFEGGTTLAALRGLRFIDTAYVLNHAYDEGQSILIEGTQGTLLDLHLGPYPYTTHKQTTASQWVTEAGLSPALDYEVVLVARTCPIRVAGNSGPMPHEITWPKMARGINERLRRLGLPARVDEQSVLQFVQACQEVADTEFTSLPLMGSGPFHAWNFHTFPPDWQLKHQVAMSELHQRAIEKLPGPVVKDLCKVFEMTTVTNKLRRVADWDHESMVQSVMLNRPSSIVLTFINHWFPELWDVQDFQQVTGHEGVRQSVTRIQRELGVPISFVTTGPDIGMMLPSPDPYGTRLDSQLDSQLPSGPPECQ